MRIASAVRFTRADRRRSVMGSLGAPEPKIWVRMLVGRLSRKTSMLLLLTFVDLDAMVDGGTNCGPCSQDLFIPPRPPARAGALPQVAGQT